MVQILTTVETPLPQLGSELPDDEIIEIRWKSATVNSALNLKETA